MKQTKRIAPYVRVELRPFGDCGWVSFGGVRRTESENERDIDGLADAIKSKVSKFGDERGAVSVEWETEEVCSFCGRTWTETSSEYNGGCCQQDIDREVQA